MRGMVLQPIDDKTIERWLDVNGNAPGDIPQNLDDIENIEQRWPFLLKYHPPTGDIWRRYVLRSYNFESLDPRQYVATRRTSRRGARCSLAKVDGLLVEAAKIVWLLNTGKWPERTLRRIDGDKWNDRFENLALSADRTKRETKRPKGVGRRYDKWQAYTYLTDGRQKHLGVYATEAEAIAAREAWDAAQDLV